MPRLTSRTLAVGAVDAAMRDRMFALFERYYAAVSRAQFERDLDAKDAAILLLDAETRVIQGFSTLRTVQVPGPDGRPCRAIFSGDTVVEQAYWGQKVLGVAFLRYLWREKARRPFEPLYWFLISKGYKTYLLMANNFVTHYPRCEAPTPPGVQALLDRLGVELFGTDYHPAEGLIRHPESLGQLREGVAEPTAEELAAHPRIRFFVARNPGWREGTELACLAEMTFTMPLAYGLKRFKKVTLSPLVRALAAPARRQTAVGRLAASTRDRLEVALSGTREP